MLVCPGPEVEKVTAQLIFIVKCMKYYFVYNI